MVCCYRNTMHKLKALYLTLALWVSCSEPELMPAANGKSLLLLIENPWKVTLYISGGEDLTARSSQMVFHFLDSGIVRVDNEDESYIGHWSIVLCPLAATGEESLCLDLDLSLDPIPYRIHLPDGLWLVESFSSELLILIAPDQNRALETRLVLQKVK